MSFQLHRLHRCSAQKGFFHAPQPSTRLPPQPWKLKTSVRWNHEIAGNATQRRKRIIVAVTGATGAPLAVSLLKHLKALDVETHLIMSKWGSATLKYELAAPDDTPRYLESLATKSYSPYDVSASISSGSFKTDGMIVVPCSMKTLAAVRIGYDNELISRAAGVTLKERRRLVLVARETPLSSIHLENMLEVTRAGAVVFPPVMAFYTRPQSVEEMVQQSVRRMIDALDLELGDHDARWKGFDWATKKAVEKELHI
jgi:4-hydroxy-3-polyprenylbenzoate decarboxylase